MGSQCNALTQLAHCTRRSKRIRRRLIMDGRRLLILLLCVLQLSRLVRSTVLEGGWIVKDATIGQPVLFLGHGGDNHCHIGRAKNTLCRLTKSTPKMKKKAFGELAMVLGDCQWLMYTGRNYKGRSQKVSVRETIKLGRVRSVKLLCPGTSSKFAWAGSILVSLISGIGLTLVVALLAYLGLVLRRRWSKRDGVGEDLEQDVSWDEAERLQNVHLVLEERVQGRSKTNLDLGGEEEEEEGVLQGDQLDIEDRQRSEN